MEELSYEGVIAELIQKLRSKFKIKDELTEEVDVLGLGLDSLDVMDYIFYLEETFNVKIKDEQIQPGGLFTIGQTAKHILEQTS